MRRRTVNWSEQDYEKIAPFLEPGSPERQELAARAGEEPAEYSDSAAIRSLAMLGARQIREELLDRGYQELAACLGEEDEQFAEDAFRLAVEAWGDDW